MREILFRGKRLDNGKWAYGDLLHDWQDKGDCIRQGAEHSECGIFAVDPATIGQFTGLTDKNGKRIFEGDIVLDEHNATGVVTMDGVIGIANWWGQGRHASFDLLAEEHGDFESNEIVGSAHDNPELLSGV